MYIVSMVIHINDNDASVENVMVAEIYPIYVINACNGIGWVLLQYISGHIFCVAHVLSNGGYLVLKDWIVEAGKCWVIMDEKQF